jgi:acyl-CoA thioester hydrolase
MDLSPLPITHRAVIPDSYLDEMGHMNVMWYTHLFSMGAWGLFQMVGLNREYFATNQAGSFALEQHIRYLKEVRVGERITIRSRVLGRTAKCWHVIHFMTLDEPETLAATSECVHAHIDMRIRRSAPMPPAICAAIDRLLAEHARLPWDPPRSAALSP